MRRVTTPNVAIRDIENVTGTAKSVIQRSVRSGVVRQLTDDEYEDALGHLLCEIVAMDRDYDPALGYQTFSSYVGRFLPGRFIDWIRKQPQFGDSRYKSTRAEFVALDDHALRHHVEGDDFVEQIIEAVSIADDLANLSERGRNIAEAVARPIAAGSSHDEIAAKLSISRRKVSRLLEDLRNELLAISLGIDGVPTTDEIVEHLHALDTSPIDID